MAVSYADVSRVSAGTASRTPSSQPSTEAATGDRLGVVAELLDVALGFHPPG
jgi:hypothetical protein